MRVRTIFCDPPVVRAYFDDALDPDEQITAKEAIASLLLSDLENGRILTNEDAEWSVEDIHSAAEEILLMVLHYFRPDLVVTEPDTGWLVASDAE